MWDHFLRLGGNEIANSARAYGYATSGGCRANWLAEREWGGITDMLDDAPYSIERIADAPWYDFRSEVTTRFYGVYVISVTGVTGSTATGSSQEGVTEGGVAGRVRRTGRSVRVRAWLTGRGRDAVDVGEAWLDSVLSGKGCGMHRDSCGASDLLLLSDVPVAMDQMESVEDYYGRAERQYRYLHEVSRISGPIPVQDKASSDGMHYGRLVEFTIYAGVPRIFGQPRKIQLQPTLPVVVQDIPYNTLPFPSAELIKTPGMDDAEPVIVSRNISPNPSVETNDAQWSGFATIPSGDSPGPYLSAGRVADLAAQGQYSYRTRVNGNGSTAAAGRARLIAAHDVPLGDVGSRVSFSVWGAGLNLQGDPNSLKSLRAEVEWRNSSGTVLSSTQIGATRTDTAGFNGTVFSAASVVRPTGATVARVKMMCETLWASSSDPNVNSDVRVYMDAVSVTIP